MSTRSTLITTAVVGLGLGAALIGCIAGAAPTVPLDTPAAVAEASTPTTPAPAAEESAPTPAPVTEERSETLNDPAPTPTVTPTPEVVTPEPVVPATPAPAATTPPEPATLVCPAWTSPGWLNAQGLPTSCLWDMPDAQGGQITLKACEQEDSINCYWDATKQGNHIGRSFININGHVFYDDSETAR